MAHAEGRGANSPWLQEKIGLHIKRQWKMWVEINPEIAAQLSIVDGDWVWVESPNQQRIKLQAALYAGTRPDTVNIPFEQGHRAYGRWAEGRGENPNWLVSNENETLSGIAAWSATRVKVYKA
jgi:molybdopterin-containing oxidoreductase family iron-sulfur binding subunit